MEIRNLLEELKNDILLLKQGIVTDEIIEHIDYAIGFLTAEIYDITFK